MWRSNQDSTKGKRWGCGDTILNSRPDKRQPAADDTRRKLAEAARFATAAVTLRPASPGARLTLAEVLDRQGAHAEAIDMLERIIQIKKNYVLAYIRLGQNLAALNRQKEAHQRYREALEMEAEDPGEYYALGLSFAALGQWRDSQAAYEKALRRNPIGVPNYVSLIVEAVVHLSVTGQPQEALAICRRATDVL